MMPKLLCVEVPRQLDSLFAELESLTPERIGALAAGFAEAEASPLLSARRALARQRAMSPDTPGAISMLAGQLALSEAMLSWEVVYGLDEETSYGARAAVLDMGVVLCVDGIEPAGARALSAPWLTALHPG